LFADNITIENIYNGCIFGYYAWQAINTRTMVIVDDAVRRRVTCTTSTECVGKVDIGRSTNATDDR
jgi:hypothetical protein